MAPNVFNTTFEVTIATATITRVEFLLVGGGFEAIDDLEFEGEPPSPTPTEPPVVQLIRPMNGLELDIPGDIPVLDINGTVTGDGLISPVTVTIAYRQPPESTAPPLTLALDLTGSGTTRQFALPGGIERRPAGSDHGHGHGGEHRRAHRESQPARSTISRSPIRNRFITEGGAAVLGDFQFGLFAGGCRIAVYERAAISLPSARARSWSRATIFTKWMSLRTAFNEKGLGCPLNEERDAVGGARAQEFEGGRIYAKVTGIAPPGTAYVPAVFVDAIDKRGGEAVNGLPLADPTDSIGPARQTWLFQRFFRPDDRSAQPSTLEIRNTPPTLSMERQLGAWFLSGRWSRPTSTRPRTNPRPPSGRAFPAATTWDPAPVDDEPPFPPPNTPNAGDLFCNGAHVHPDARR